MRMTDRRLAEAESVRLGAVRVSESHLPDEDAGSKQIKALRKHVARTLEEFEWWSAKDAPRLAGLGGTIRNLAAAAQKRLDLTDLDVQGFVLTRAALGELIEELSSRPASKRGSVRGIKPDRGDVILGGAVVLDAAMEQGGFDEIEVTEAGLREGILFERMLEDRDPPLLDDVRRASVENLEHRYGGDHAHAQHVARLSLQVFDALAQEGLHDLGDAERADLWAAGILHDIGTAIDYDDHHRHSHYLILNSSLPGYSPRELELIALVARWHRKGAPDPSQLGDLERKGDGRRLRVLCGIIRLVEQLERARDQSIASVSVQRDGDTVRLVADTNGSGADPSVAVWAAQRGSDLLAEAIGEEVEVVRG
jgi:exopolyphosphatase/guanosine-5'-triphosphate,3'-diphosphate pyrophosphatase